MARRSLQRRLKRPNFTHSPSITKHHKDDHSMPDDNSAETPDTAASPDLAQRSAIDIGELGLTLTEEQRAAMRANARRVLRESGVAEILQTLNKNALQGRGRFEEYDSGVLFKWGQAYTTRHIWVDVAGANLRFRLKPHIRCAASVPICDGEYHTFTAATWRIPNAVLREVDANYKRPVAESSDD
jgi:hypothetical protein